MTCFDCDCYGSTRADAEVAVAVELDAEAVLFPS